MPSLGISDKELDQTLERRSAQKDRDGRVCICGHPAKCHSSLAAYGNPIHEHALARGGEVCIQTRVYCECKQFEPVIEVADSRLFKFKTRGHGAEHALAQGIAAVRRKARVKALGANLESNDSVHRNEAAKAAEASVTYLDGFKCRFCASVDGLTPIAYRVVNAQIVSEADQSTPYNALVCEDCRKQKLLEAAARG